METVGQQTTSLFTPVRMKILYERKQRENNLLYHLQLQTWTLTKNLIISDDVLVLMIGCSYT